jgi:hypothetical protein
MKLTEEQVKEITTKVHKDLNLLHSDKYPIICNFRNPSKGFGEFDFPTWGGSYDYRDPESVGDDSWGKYPEYIISIDDEKGEAFAYHYYTGHLRIKLNKQGKYEVVGRLYEIKENPDSPR